MSYRRTCVLGLGISSRKLGLALLVSDTLAFTMSYEVAGAPVEDLVDKVASVARVYGVTKIVFARRDEPRWHPLDLHFADVARAVDASFKVTTAAEVRNRASSEGTWAGLSRTMIAQFPELKLRELPTRRRGIRTAKERVRMPPMLAAAAAEFAYRDHISQYL